MSRECFWKQIFADGKVATKSVLDSHHWLDGYKTVVSCKHLEMYRPPLGKQNPGQIESKPSLFIAEWNCWTVEIEETQPVFNCALSRCKPSLQFPVLQATRRTEASLTWVLTSSHYVADFLAFWWSICWFTDSNVTLKFIKWFTCLKSIYLESQL